MARKTIRAMQTTPGGWTIIDAEAGVLSFSYMFAREGQANSFVARLPSGGLMIISPPRKIDDAALAELAAYGKVEAIVSNNGFHHLGIARWRELFPQARCFAAPGAAARIAKKSKDAGALEPLSALQPLLGPDVAVVEAPKSKAGETWAWAKIGGGHAWYASDILANMERLPSNFVVRLLFKLSNSAPGYKVFSLAARLILQDRKAAFSRLLDDVRKHPVKVMVPAHGGVLDHATVGTETEALISAALA